MNRLEALLTLTATRRIGAVRYERLLESFGSPEEILKAPTYQLEKVKGIGPQLAREIKKAYESQAGLKELEEIHKAGVKIITYEDDSYPENLRSIYDYPLILYVKGNLITQDNIAIAIVGTRRATIYGKNQAERLSYELALRGVCVVSGLARGIDTMAHIGALKAKGRTIAVLGSGLGEIYPRENKKLADQISENGAVISEFPLHTPPDAHNFPVRNRIISGLSLGVVVIEAPLRSGALITVDLALDQGREVFAVPGKIDSASSQGCHRLIKAGAKLVENVDDILEELSSYQINLKQVPQEDKKLTALDYREEILFNLLARDEAKNIDEIIIESKLPPALVSSSLLSLELKKYIKQLPGKNFVRII